MRRLIHTVKVNGDKSIKEPSKTIIYYLPKLEKTIKKSITEK